MNKVYKKYNFCITSLNMTGAKHFWLFSIENLKFPWQWWLHQHWAVLAVKRLKQLTHYLLMYFGRYRWFAAASRWRPTSDLTEWDSLWTRMEKLCRCPLLDDSAGNMQKVTQSCFSSSLSPVERKHQFLSWTLLPWVSSGEQVLYTFDQAFFPGHWWKSNPMQCNEK